MMNKPASITIKNCLPERYSTYMELWKDLGIEIRSNVLSNEETSVTLSLPDEEFGIIYVYVFDSYFLCSKLFKEISNYLFTQVESADLILKLGIIDSFGTERSLLEVGGKIKNLTI